MEGSTTSDILRLERYQGRRADRLARAVALHATDPIRSDLIRYLSDALDTVHADRAAVVWIEDVGTPVVHPYCVLDLGSDTPRREFPLQPLVHLQSAGPNEYRFSEFDRDGSDSKVAFSTVSLGLDDLRVFFLTVSHRVHGQIPDFDEIERLCYHAGRCAGRILHADVGASDYAEIPIEERPFDVQRRDTFSGWVVLKDLDGIDEIENEEMAMRVGARFMVLRFIRAVVDEGLAFDPEQVPDRLEEVFDELGSIDPGDEERVLWNRVVEACRVRDWGDMLTALIALGDVVDAHGQFHGALETHRVAYDLAVLLADSPAGIDAARLCGRALRKVGRLDEAVHWYESAARTAEAVGDASRYANALSGLANVYRDRGNFRGAREQIHRAIKVAEAADAVGQLATCYHTLCNIECEMEDYSEGLRCLWNAVELYPSEEGRVRALLDLADLLLKTGNLDASEAAYRIVGKRVRTPALQVMVAAGQASVCAARGDWLQFEPLHHILISERVRIEKSSPWIWAQISLEHAEALVTFEQFEEAERWLANSREISQKHGFGKLRLRIDDVAELLGTRSSRAPLIPPPHVEGEMVTQVRRGLEQLAGEYANP